MVRGYIMTVKELIEELKKYAENVEVTIDVPYVDESRDYESKYVKGIIYRVKKNNNKIELDWYYNDENNEE